MTADVRDPGKRIRWLVGTGLAMGLSTFVALVHFLSWHVDQKGPVNWLRIAVFLRNDVLLSLFFTFWILFPILYFCYIRKSEATLEYERILREGTGARN